MYNKFETERFDPLKIDKVLIPDYKFGHNERGELNVWIESSDKGKRFLRQIKIDGKPQVLHTGVYTNNCYIIREKSSGNYFFLDINETGIWLFNQGFFGSENFNVDESTKIKTWLASAA